MKYDEFGREVPDDTPVEVPIKFKRPPSIQELIALHVKSAMQVERAIGKDDEEDFVEGEELDDVLTPYELHAYAGEADEEFRRAKLAKELVDKFSRKEENTNTVNKDRLKEKRNVQSGGIDSDQQGAGNAREKRSAVGGEGRSAGDGSGGVSESGK